MAFRYLPDIAPAANGKCQHCNGQLRTANMDAIRCDECGVLYMLVETQTYAHRNGSTDPPTQPGWYWFDEEPGEQWIDLGRVLCFVPDAPDEADVCVMDNLYYPSAIPLEHMRGVWHGPLQPPWETQQ